jgi:hypothetical protein
MIGESGGGFWMSPFVLIINEPNFEEIKDATIRRHSWARIGLRSQAAKSFDAQPRLPGSNGKTSKAEISRLSREYLEVRNTQMRAKAFLAEMAAAVRRNELIEKRLVTAQAQSCSLR